MDFPLGPVARRAEIRTKETITSSWWGVALLGASFALIGAFFTLPTPNSWGDRFVDVLASAAIAVIAVAILAFAWHLSAYVRSGHQDPNWEAVAFHKTDDVVFIFRRKPGGMPSSIREHGVMQAIIRKPDGEVVVCPEEEGHDHSHEQGTRVPCDGFGPGTYDVAWYGSRRRPGRFYEIARTKVVTQPYPDDGR